MKAFVALLYMLTVDCCWLFSLKITATASKLRSKSAEQLLKLMNSREVFLSPHFQICFHWNHFIFSASACQPKLWIPGKYFSLNSFIFVTNILLLTGGIRRQDPNNYSDTETKALGEPQKSFLWQTWSFGPTGLTPPPSLEVGTPTTKKFFFDVYFAF